MVGNELLKLNGREWTKVLIDQRPQILWGKLAVAVLRLRFSDKWKNSTSSKKVGLYGQKEEMRLIRLEILNDILILMESAATER